MKATRHIVGPYQNRSQCCSRCGAILFNNRSILSSTHTGYMETEPILQLVEPDEGVPEFIMEEYVEDYNETFSDKITDLDIIDCKAKDNVTIN